MNQKQFRRFIVRPTLNHIGLWSQAAENLLIGTAAVESNFEFIDQITGEDRLGPAAGIYQMEKATHEDLWENFLKHKQSLRLLVDSLRAPYPPPWEQLASNLAYATAMTRIHYYRIKAPLPEFNDLPGLANYWKKYYNTEMGKGQPKEFIRRYRLFNPE